MSSATPLPPPRRIISMHGPDGPHVIDDTVHMAATPASFRFGQAFTQPGFPADPNAKDWLDAQPDDSFIRSDGVSVGFLEYPPGAQSENHFTNSIDYLTVISGEIELGTADGKTHTVRQGDLVVQCASVHSWANKTDKWARIFGVCVPSKPVVVDGKTLDQAPFSYHKMAG